MKKYYYQPNNVIGDKKRANGTYSVKKVAKKQTADCGCRKVRRA